MRGPNLLCLRVYAQERVSKAPARLANANDGQRQQDKRRKPFRRGNVFAVAFNQKVAPACDVLVTAPGEFPVIVDMALTIDRIAKKPGAMGLTPGELIQGAGVVRETGMDPERLTLGMVVIEDDDVLSVTKKRVEETCRGAIPRADGRAGRQPAGIDLPAPAMKRSKLRHGIGFGNLHGRPGSERASIAGRLPIPCVRLGSSD